MAACGAQPWTPHREILAGFRSQEYNESAKPFREARQFLSQAARVSLPAAYPKPDVHGQPLLAEPSPQRIRDTFNS